MPGVWARIEARQTYTFSFRRMASALATAAMALCIALGVYMMWVPSSSGYSSQTYIEALAEANPLDTPDSVGPVSLELSEPPR